MTDPIRIELPHQLGISGAHARIDSAIDDLAARFPIVRVAAREWQGEDRLAVTVEAMGQRVAGRVTLFERRAAIEIDLPPMLALFAQKLRDKISREGPRLLG